MQHMANHIHCIVTKVNRPCVQILIISIFYEGTVNRTNFQVKKLLFIPIT